MRGFTRAHVNGVAAFLRPIYDLHYGMLCCDACLLLYRILLRTFGGSGPYALDGGVKQATDVLL